jgi:hypothetical protein
MPTAEAINISRIPLSRVIASAMLVLTVAAATGCGLLSSEQGQARTQAAEQLEAARAIFAKATRGYSDPAAQGQAPQSREAFRVKTLSEAIGPLQTIINSNAPQLYKQQARRLLAEVHAARARHAADQAGDAAGKLDPLRGKLQAQVTLARQVQQRGGTTSDSEGGASDESDASELLDSASDGGQASEQSASKGESQQAERGSFLEGIFSGGSGGNSAAEAGSGSTGGAQQASVKLPPAAGSQRAQVQQIIEQIKTGLPQSPAGLSTGLESNEQRLAELQNRIGTLEQQLAEQRKQHAQIEQQAQTHFAKSQKLRNQAFDAEGAKHFDLLDQAEAAQAKGRKDATEAAKRQTRIDSHEKTLADLKERASATKAAAETLRQRIAAYQQQGQQLAKRQTQASRTLRQAQNQAVEALKALQQQQQAVTRHYNTAANRFDKAVNVMKAAVNAAPARERATLRSELLALHVEQARILSEQANATATVARTVKAGADADLLGPRSRPFEQAASALTESHGALRSQLSDTVDAGIAVAEAINRAGGQLADIVEKQRRRLETYQGMVATSLAAAS